MKNLYSCHRLKSLATISLMSGLIWLWAGTHQLSAQSATRNQRQTAGSSQILTSVGFQKPVIKADIMHPEVILVPEERGWLVSVLAPFLGLLSTPGQPVQVLAIPSEKTETIWQRMHQIDDEKVLSLIPTSKLTSIIPSDIPNLKIINTASSPLQASVQIVSDLTQSVPEIILSSMDNPEWFMQASVMAAQYSIPLILFKKPLESNRFRRFVREKKIKKIYVMAETGLTLQHATPGVEKVVVNQQQAAKLIIEKIGRKNIHNIILAALPNARRHSRPLTSDPVAYIPYLSWLRQSPVVFSESFGGMAAERSLFGYISNNGLSPRNITILGDYSRIESIPIPEDQMHMVYDAEVDMEPAARPADGKAIPFGVGRLPFFKLSSISLYYSYLLQREQLLTQRHPRFTMISNLEAKEGAVLFLAEAVSKATAQELKNLGLKGQEFYRESHRNMNIWKAALASELVIYEGHINQLYILGRADDEDPGDESRAKKEDEFKLPYFERLPFLILQSCNSLDDPDMLLTRGITGIIGSSTRVHSASGSSFIKAYLDSTLYQDLTAGEALRDAKNYFLSIVKLKELRGHLEQPKTMRVALTFRLWGDPESKLFYKKLPSPTRPTVQTRVTDGKSLEFITPSNKYKQIKNGFYHLPYFPGAQTAGVVTVSKNPDKISRRINAFYFARIPVDGVWKDRTQFDVILKNPSSPRSVSLEDPMNRWVYFVHFPFKIKNNEKILLRLQ
jgi:hypothetical protein